VDLSVSEVDTHFFLQPQKGLGMWIMLEKLLMLPRFIKVYLPDAAKLDKMSSSIKQLYA